MENKWRARWEKLVGFYGRMPRWLGVMVPLAAIFTGLAAINNPGEVSASLLGAMPFAAGFFAVMLGDPKRRLSPQYQFKQGNKAIIVLLVLAAFVLREGTVCLVLASPLLFGAGWVGALFAGFLLKRSDAASQRVGCVVLLLPLAMAPVEANIPEQTELRAVTKTVEVNAAPEVVWQQLVHADHIRPEELGFSFDYLIGVPKPVSGIVNPQHTERDSVWQKGIHFQEHITDYVPGKYLRWTYGFKPGDIPATALDRHVTLGGHYFDVIDTSYELVPEAMPAKTKLTLMIHYRVTSHVNPYATLWADFMLNDFERVILGMYRGRAERG